MNVVKFNLPALDKPDSLALSGQLISELANVFRLNVETSYIPRKLNSITTDKAAIESAIALAGMGVIRVYSEGAINPSNGTIALVERGFVEFCPGHPIYSVTDDLLQFMQGTIEMWGDLANVGDQWEKIVQLAWMPPPSV